jgi:hypothetical protein
MAIKWRGEACDLGLDPQSGALITRLTSAAMHNINIYCEQPYTNPAGTRIAYTRAASADPRVPPFELCVADIEKLRVAVIEPEVAGSIVATSSWSGQIYYLRPNGELIRVCLDTLEKHIVFTHWDLPGGFGFSSVSPDQRYLIGERQTPQYTSQIIRVDLETQEWTPIFEHDEVLGHIQFNPVHGRQILVQHNRGMRIDHLGRRKVVESNDRFATHLVIDADGGNPRWLPIGPPHTAGSCGHSAWIADTGRIGLAVRWQGMTVVKEELDRGNPHDPLHPEGNFVVAGPDDPKPQIFRAPKHLFNHVNVSKCGKLFVADCYWHGIPGPVALVMGNLATGKHRVLVSDSGAQGGGPACSHPHPYLTADNRNVIYNSDRFHISHVYAARVPVEFLESLE